MSGSGREALPEDREWSGALQEDLEWSGGPLGRLAVVGRPSRRGGSSGEACHVKSGPGQNPSAWTSFGSQKWSGGKLWQPKLVPPGPVLAAKSGPTLPKVVLGVDWFWRPKVVQVQVLAAKSGPGPGFGSQKWSRSRFWLPKVVLGEAVLLIE